MHTIFLLEKLKERDHLEEAGVNEKKIVLDWILGKLGGRVWTGSI
jgi:hypothetical protein